MSTQVDPLKTVEQLNAKMKDIMNKIHNLNKQLKNQNKTYHTLSNNIHSINTQAHTYFERRSQSHAEGKIVTTEQDDNIHNMYKNAATLSKRLVNREHEIQSIEDKRRLLVNKYIQLTKQMVQAIAKIPVTHRQEIIAKKHELKKKYYENKKKFDEDTSEFQKLFQQYTDLKNQLGFPFIGNQFSALTPSNDRPVRQLDIGNIEEITAEPKRVNLLHFFRKTPKNKVVPQGGARKKSVSKNKKGIASKQ